MHVNSNVMTDQLYVRLSVRFVLSEHLRNGIENNTIHGRNNTGKIHSNRLTHKHGDFNVSVHTLIV